MSLYYLQDEIPSYVVSYGLEDGILEIDYRRSASFNETVKDIVEAIDCLKIDFPPGILKVKVVVPTTALPTEITVALWQSLANSHLKAVAVFNSSTEQGYIVIITNDRTKYPYGALLG